MFQLPLHIPHTGCTPATKGHPHGHTAPRASLGKANSKRHPFLWRGWALSGLTHIQFSSPSSRGDHTFGSLAVKQGHVTSSEQLVRSRSDVMCITSKVKHLLVGLSSRSLFSVLGSPELPPEAKVPWNAELPWKPTVKDARARSKIPF